MKKIGWLFICVITLLSKISYAEAEFGKGYINSAINRTQYRCINDPEMQATLKSGKISIKEFCGCIAEETKKNAEKSDLAKKVDSDSIGIKKFTIELAKLYVAGMTYCTNKLLYP
ncbi:hypothetical protein JFL47_12060 [Haemophilus haemoglobinophilus]|nr:hypothetical protein [Canicola haemoglobinophilus]MBN6711941.1 hypothetical protein [Canicola haemoglobinophilus]